MKCFMLIGVSIGGGDECEIQIESITGTFPIKYIEDLVQYIQEELPNLDIYEEGHFDEAQGYVQLMIHAKLNFEHSTYSYDTNFKIVDAFYHGYI